VGAVGVVPFPQPRRLARADVARLAPSVRSLAWAGGLLVLAAAVYVAARETPVFAVQTVAVRGAPPDVAAEVRRALEPIRGESLLALRTAEVDRRLAAVPDVASATYDRAFPHTLTVVVVPEQPVAVLRRGRGSWLVSARGRVLRAVQHGGLAALPRIWISAGTDLPPGATLAPDSGARAAAALALARRTGFDEPIQSVTVTGDSLAFKLRSGVELRLGASVDLALKLAVAARILPIVGADATYVDVSLPARPVAMTAPATLTNPQPGGTG
jgi:cell division protein FtsQ